MFPAMKLAAPAVSLSSDGAWRLLAVCKDGSLHVWDLRSLITLLQASLHPLLASVPQSTAGHLAAGYPIMMVLLPSLLSWPFQKQVVCHA